MHAHPMLFEYVFGQHSPLKGVFANIKSSPSGKGTGWGSRFRIFCTPFPGFLPGLYVKFGVNHYQVLTGFSWNDDDSPKFVFAGVKPSFNVG
jgi:hypothetical protein